MYRFALGHRARGRHPGAWDVRVKAALQSQGMVASVTVQQNPGELSCTWHKVMGRDPLHTEGCSAEALDIHLSIQLEAK